MVICLFLNKNILAQNLINNGSFENYSAPITWNNWGGEFISYSQTPTLRVLHDWDELNSADCFIAACTQTYSGAPLNRNGYCQAKDGNNYVGFMLFANGATNNGKEYIYQQLTAPLQSGKIYCLSFYISRADRKEYAIKNIGAYFSNNIQSTGSIGYINKTPQVVNQNGVIIDTTQWTHILGCFTAIGGEQYITIGNFNSDANTDTLHSGTNNPKPSDPEYAYYYIDDITLIDQTTVGLNELNVSSKINLFPNPNNGTMQLDYNLVNENEATMKLFDVADKLINIYALHNTKGSISINERSLMNGIYFYSILVKEKVIKNDKIVIIK